jgi:hypothetical protein
MRVRVPLPALLIAAFATMTLGPAAHLAGGAAACRAGAWSLARGEYRSEIQAGSHSTHSYYGDDGKRVDFGRAPGKFEQNAVSWRSEIGWRKRLSLQLGLTGMSVSGFDGPPATIARLDTVPTRTGLSEVDLGLHLNIMNGNRAMALEAGWHAPAGYDRVLNPALGDGRQELYGRLNLGNVLGQRGFFEGLVGAAYRFHKFGSPGAAANLDPRLTTNVYYDFGADLGWWIGKALMICGRYQGRMLGTTTGVMGTANVHQVGPIRLTGDAQLDESAHVAGPMVLYRVDERLDVIGGSYSTPVGRNALHFDEVYVSLAFKQSKLKRNQGFLGSSAP